MNLVDFLTYSSSILSAQSKIGYSQGGVLGDFIPRSCSGQARKNFGVFHSLARPPERLLSGRLKLTGRTELLGSSFELLLLLLLWCR